MDPFVLAETDGEVYDTGALRMRILAQSPDQPIAVTDSTVPPGFPGPVRHRHAHVDSGLDGPATLSRVRHAAGETVECGVAFERRRGEVEQP